MGPNTSANMKSLGFEIIELGICVRVRVVRDVIRFRAREMLNLFIYFDPVPILSILEPFGPISVRDLKLKITLKNKSNAENRDNK